MFNLALVRECWGFFCQNYSPHLHDKARSVKEDCFFCYLQEIEFFVPFIKYFYCPLKLCFPLFFIIMFRFLCEIHVSFHCELLHILSYVFMITYVFLFYK